MLHRILILNPGSTSTKVAVYDDEVLLFQDDIRHMPEELASFQLAVQQVDFRLGVVKKVLQARNVSEQSLSAICARGGRIPPCAPGAIRINQDMVDYLEELPDNTHPATSGCLVAYRMAQDLSIPSYIYDGTSVDELLPIAKVSGMPELPRFAVGHTLNTRAMAIKCAKEVMCKPFANCTFIVAHIGGGVSVRLFKDGRNIDSVNDDNGGFAPERAGCLSAVPLVQLCFSGKYTKLELIKKIRGNGGLKAHLGTSDGIEIEKRIASGDKQAKLVYEAMAYSIAKDIGQMSVPVAGNIDRIIITGGIAHSKYITDYITNLVSFIAPVELMPGEFEIEALALGAMRVLRGQETASEFQLPVQKM